MVALTDTGIWTTDEAGQTVKDDSFQNVVFDCPAAPESATVCGKDEYLKCRAIT